MIYELTATTRAAARPHDPEARLALLQALYLQIGLTLAAAAQAAQADYGSFLTECERLAA